MLALSPPEIVELLIALPATRTPFLWGPPGIGKSALVRDAAERLGLPCVTLLGTQLAPEDLIGVPRIVLPFIIAIALPRARRASRERQPLL